MSVSAIGLLGNFSWAEYSSQASSAATSSVAGSQTEQKTMVTISAAGRQASQSKQTEPDTTRQKSAAATTGQAADPDPVENYRLPNWMSSLILGGSVDLEAFDNEMHSFWNRANELSSDGELSNTDVAQLKVLGNNMPAHKAMEANRQYRERYSNEIAEFDGISQQYWRQALGEQGIVTHNDYVEKVLHAPGDNIELRNSMVGKLLANPRAIELMGILGIERPTLV